MLPLLARPAREGTTPGGRLLAFGRAYLDLVTRPKMMALDRLVIAAGARQPELLAAYLAAVRIALSPGPEGPL
jgi:hypothetical protein